MSGDGYGTPIRLFFDSGILGDNAIADFLGFGGEPFPPMELMALSIALSVERKVGGMSIPFGGGSRFGIDMNMVNSTIVIEGIFTDDDVNRRVVAATAATAMIDFGVEHGDLSSVGNFTQVANSRFGSLKSLELTQKDGTVKKVLFGASTTASLFVSKGTTNVTTGGGSTTIFMHSTTFLTPAEMAASLSTALGASHLNATISASITTSEFVPAAGSSKITLTQTATGNMSGTSSVDFTVNTGSNYAPYHRPFAGGASGSAGRAKSAGDKVQDLYGILHNTDRGTAALVVGALLGAAAFAATGGLATVALAGSAVAVGGSAIVTGAITEDNFYNGDYPIGIQIPYNSMIQAEDGRKYDLRNFLIRTGWNKTTYNKVSDGNTKGAGGEFDTGDDATGIQGTIQKLDIGYNAGEQHYTYQMVFAPIDMII